MDDNTNRSPAPSSTGHEPYFHEKGEAGAAIARNTWIDVRRWWSDNVIGTIDQIEVVGRHEADSDLSGRYLFMTAMSAGIAVLGLLLPSTAVVIGAMLLSPLMGPIMALGFALSIGDYNWLYRSARTLILGSLAAVALCALIVFISPIQTVTPEIASRTQPNLFDLLVALFSGMAGAYATVREKSGAIVGVAIATALMPPLAVVGFGLATMNWPAFSGALLLYVTNFIVISLTAFVMAKLYGFTSKLSPRQSTFQNLVVVSVFFALVVPLAFSLAQIAFQTNSQRVIREEIEKIYSADSEIARLDVDFRAEPILVVTTVYTPRLRAESAQNLESALTERLEEPVELRLREYQVGTSESAAAEAQLSAARANEEAAETARAQSLATRLALVAGVPESEVTIDSTRLRATVRAQRLDGATLAAYRALEMRIAASEPDWTIELLPPVGELPAVIAWSEDGPTPEGAQALAVVEWAARRVNLPIALVGPEEQANEAAQLLQQRGVSVSTRTGGDELSAEWGGG